MATDGVVESSLQIATGRDVNRPSGEGGKRGVDNAPWSLGAFMARRADGPVAGPLGLGPQLYAVQALVDMIATARLGRRRFHTPAPLTGARMYMIITFITRIYEKIAP